MDNTYLLTEAQEALEQMQHNCTSCDRCLPECALLQAYGNPYTIAYDIQQGNLGWQPAFECHLCGLCTAACPHELPVAQMFLHLRRAALQQQPQRLKAYKGLLTYESLGASPWLSGHHLPEDCRRVFFPGCALAGSRPQQVQQLFQHLQQQDPALGLVLDCCAKPSHDLGASERFGNMFGRLQTWLVSQGVEEVWVACPNCYQIFADYGRPLQVRSIYEILASNPLPPEPIALKLTAKIHDPCGTSWQPQVQDAVRQLARQLGCDLQDMPHQGRTTICCGEGAAAPVQAPQWSQTWSQKRGQEAGDTIMLTYCAACVDRLQRHCQVLHILDLLLIPQKALQGRLGTGGSLRRYWRRWRLRRRYTAATSQTAQKD